MGVQGMNPHEIRGGWRILKWYIFRGLSFCEILGGGGAIIYREGFVF